MMSGLVELLSKESLSVAAMEELFLRHVERPTFTREAVAALDVLDAHHLWRPVWLLRRASKDARLSTEVLAHAAHHVDGTTHWLARLNFCQLYAEAGCPDEAREMLYPFLRHCFADRRPIVRAWALSALMPYRTDVRYRAEITEMVKLAKKETSKAMQARLRHLLPARRPRQAN